MKKYDLLRSGDSIIRALEVQGDRVLVIDCTKRTMPVWVELDTLESYSECTNDDLSDVTGVVIVNVDDLDVDQRKVMYERHTMIAPVLAFVADNRMRSRLICSVAREHGVSKQTVRSYLCLYLIYMDVTALAPKRREDDRQLTQDEKNIRWALNKFFYTTKKQSLMTAYTMMLKEKYCDGLGILVEEYPSFYQFRYFYRKTRNLQNFYISAVQQEPCHPVLVVPAEANKYVFMEGPFRQMGGKGGLAGAGNAEIDVEHVGMPGTEEGVEKEDYINKQEKIKHSTLRFIKDT